MAELEPDEDQRTPEELLEQGKALQAQGKHAEAIELLSKAVEKGAGWESRFRLANSLAVEAQVESAYDHWKEVVGSPDWNIAHVQGELAGQLSEALRHVSFETTVDQDDPKTAYLQAKICHMFGQHDVVKHALTKTVTRNPEYEDCLDWLMQFHLEERSYDDALKLLDPLMNRYPQAANLSYWVGELNFLSQRLAVAIRLLCGTVKLDPSKWEAHARLGDIYAAQHRFEEADQAYGLALALQPNNVTLILGSVEAAKRLYQFERALQLLEQATQIDPNNANVQVEFATLSFQMGALDKAVPGLELALQANPNDALLQTNLARAYTATGQWEKAIPLLQKAFAANADSELAYLLGRAHAEIGKKPEALVAYQRAVEMAPDRAAYQTALGKELLAAGQQEEALKALATAAQLEPTNSTAQLTIAGLYKKLGRSQEALKAYLAASAAEPERVDIHLQVGVLGLTCDSLDEASHAFKEVLRLSPEPHPVALAGMAQIYQRRGMNDIALDFYRQALQLNPGQTAAVQAVSVIFLRDENSEGLKSYVRDLLEPMRANMPGASALVAAFKAYLESKQLLGPAAEIQSLHAEMFPSPEAHAEQARLYLTWAEQLQQKGGKERQIYKVLRRLHQSQPELPGLKERLDTLRVHLGASVEMEAIAPAEMAAVSSEAPPASSTDFLDEVFAPATSEASHVEPVTVAEDPEPEPTAPAPLPASGAPEVAPLPASEAAPVPTAEAQVANAPVTAGVEANPSPAPAAEATAQEVTPEPAPTAEVTPEPAPMAEVTPVPAPSPEVTPEPAPSPEVTPEPAPTAEVTPEPAPMAEVAPEPAPTAEVTPEPAPMAEVAPEPAPTAEVTPEPTPMAEVTPEPAPSPEVTPEPTPMAEVTPEPAPSPEVTPEPTPMAEEDTTSEATPALASAARETLETPADAEVAPVAEPEAVDVAPAPDVISDSETTQKLPTVPPMALDPAAAFFGSAGTSSTAFDPIPSTGVGAPAAPAESHDPEVAPMAEPHPDTETNVAAEVAVEAPPAEPANNGTRDGGQLGATNDFLRQRMFELRINTHRPTQQRSWERSLGEYLLASAAVRPVMQPRELDDDGRDELCELYLESARHMREAGWLEQACTVLNTALLYSPQHEGVLDEMEAIILEWVDFLEVHEAYQEAVALLEGQFERRPSDIVTERLGEVFTVWSDMLRRHKSAAEALADHLASRRQHWRNLKAEWEARAGKTP